MFCFLNGGNRPVITSKTNTSRSIVCPIKSQSFNKNIINKIKIYKKKPKQNKTNQTN